MTIPPPTPLAYEGAMQPIQYITRTFDPVPANWQFNVPTIWINTSSQSAWILLAKPFQNAYWEPFAFSSGSLLEIAVPDGDSPVLPLAGLMTFNAGTGMSIVGGTNEITFSASSSGFTWVPVTTSTETLSAENMYLVDNGASLVTFTLPATASLGDTFGVVGYSAGMWTVVTTGSQTIRFGEATASSSLSATLASHTVVISCIVAGSTNAVFKVMDVLGNLTII